MRTTLRSLFTLGLVASAACVAVQPPSLISRRDDASKGTVIDTWVDSNVIYTMYGRGELEEIEVPAFSASEHGNITVDEPEGTVKVRQWSQGIGLLVSGEVNPKVEAGPIIPRVCKTSQPAESRCRKEIYYWWGEDFKQGTWYTAWERTGQTAYSGGFVGLTDTVITLPTFSGSVGIGIGILSGSLGISPNGASSVGRTYGCVAIHPGCNRLWIQKKMNWKDGNFWQHEYQYDDGTNQCSICNNEYDKGNELIGHVHADWAATLDGFPVIIPGCSPCSD